MVQLTEAIIKGKTKLDKLAEVRNLNLWGQDITDVSILQRTPHVEILSLSVNGITTLREFMHCKELKELYLRKNNVASLGDIRHTMAAAMSIFCTKVLLKASWAIVSIRYLMPLAHLKVLWLSDNPCAELSNYRQLVVAHLPQLEKLDNVEVTQAEKDAAKRLVLLQPATSAELTAADEGWDATSADAPDPFSDFAQQQQQQQHKQQLATAAFVPEPWVQGPSLQSAVLGVHTPAVGQAVISSNESGGCAATIGVTVPGRAGAAISVVGGMHGAGVTAAQRQQEQQYNPQRYSSQPGSQVPLGQPQALAPTEEFMQSAQKFSPETNIQQQQYSSTPGRVQSSRTPPIAGSANVLYAVMALLADLDASQLAIVQKEVELRLSGQQRVP